MHKFFRCLLYECKYNFYQLLEKTYKNLAFILPKRLVYWCSIRLIASVTQSQYSNQPVSELTAMDALKRWEKDGKR